MILRGRVRVRWPRTRWLAVSGGVLGVLSGALAWVVFASPLLVVANIEVIGQQRIPRSRVVATAAVPEKPLARVDSAAVATRVTGLRVVDSVRIQRVWPSTLRIRVDERVPVAAVPSGSRYALLDGEGVRVATVPQPPGHLPVVRIQRTGATGATSTVGQNAPRVRRTALGVLGALPGSLSGKVAAVTVDENQYVTLRMRGGATVIWGAPARNAEKARVLRSLLRRVNARTYNVSSPRVVTTG